MGPAGLVEGGEGGHVDCGGGGGGGGGPGLGGDHLVHHHVRVPPTEGNLPAVQLPEENAETVDVTVSAGGLSSQELRSLQSREHS